MLLCTKEYFRNGNFYKFGFFLKFSLNLREKKGCVFSQGGEKKKKPIFFGFPFIFNRGTSFKIFFFLFIAKTGWGGEGGKRSAPTKKNFTLSNRGGIMFKNWLKLLDLWNVKILPLFFFLDLKKRLRRSQGLIQ